MGRGYEHHHVCLSGWLLILRVTSGGISLGGCWHAGREKKQVGGGGKGKKRERFSLMFFSHALVFHPILYPPAEVCRGVTRQPPWCEPDRNVASFHRHLISLPITFPKLALRGCLGGERVIDPSQLCVSLKQSSGHRASPQHSPALHTAAVPRAPGDSGCVLGMDNDPIMQLLYVPHMQVMTPGVVFGG